MMEAVNTAETSVTFYENAQHNIPKDSQLYLSIGSKFQLHHAGQANL
jgi:hypothetical protein